MVLCDNSVQLRVINSPTNHSTKCHAEGMKITKILCNRVPWSGANVEPPEPYLCREENRPCMKHSTHLTHRRAITLVAAQTLVALAFLVITACNSRQPGAEATPGTTAADTASGEILIGNTGGMLYPCKWTFTVEQGAGGEATLVSTARIDSGWHLYSQQMPAKTPLAMEFSYEPQPGYRLEGKTIEGEPRREYEPNLRMEVNYFEKEAVFRQKIKATGREGLRITGTVAYTACQTQCVTSEEDFVFEVKGVAGK